MALRYRQKVGLHLVICRVLFGKSSVLYVDMEDVLGREIVHIVLPTDLFHRYSQDLSLEHNLEPSVIVDHAILRLAVLCDPFLLHFPERRRERRRIHVRGRLGEAGQG